MKRTSITASGLWAVSFCVLAVAVSGAPWAAEPKAPAKEQQAQSIQQVAGTLRYQKFPQKGTTVLYWNGGIYPPMAQTFEAALAQFKPDTKRFVLVLDSPGGSVNESEHVIALLRDLKKTHRFDTAVDAGATCASMCPFIYAQGQRRMAAPASMWMFHETMRINVKGDPLYLERDLWIELVDKYFPPAGISPRWIDHLKGAVKSRDYFASGDSLLRTKTGLITNAIKNFRDRDIPQG
jgi:ATP-dependent protease ClpP protease subunit